MARINPKPADIDDDDDELQMTVKLKSGRFESSISIPLMSPDEAKREFIDQWMTLMIAGLRCSPKRGELP